MLRLQSKVQSVITAVGQTASNFSLVIEVLNGQKVDSGFIYFFGSCWISLIECKSSFNFKQVVKLTRPRHILSVLEHYACSISNEYWNGVSQVVLDGCLCFSLVESTSVIVIPMVSSWEIHISEGGVLDQDGCQHQLTANHELTLSNIVSEEVDVFWDDGEDRSEDGASTPSVDKIAIVGLE